MLPAVAVVVAVMLAFPISTSGRPFDAVVEFSDGAIVSGALYPGSDKIKLRGSNGFQEVSWGDASEVVFTIASAWDERAWTFDEPGKTAKTMGDVFHSIVLLKTEVTRRDGVKLHGEMFSDAAKLTATDGKTRKILFLSKLTGAPCGTPEAIVFPTRIRLGATASPLQSNKELLADPTAVALAKDTLERIPIRKREDGTLETPSDVAVSAVRAGNVVRVRWAAARAGEKDCDIIKDNLKSMNDFFDTKVLLAATPVGSDDILTLILFSRKGKTTLDAAKSQPWRPEAALWRVDRESGRALAGTRNYLFRGIEGENESTPTVELETMSSQASATVAAP